MVYRLLIVMYFIISAAIMVTCAVAKIRQRRRRLLHAVRNYPFASQLMDPDETYDDDGLIPLPDDAAPVPPGVEPPANRVVQAGRETKFQRWAAAQVKGKTGLPSMTKANRLMVQKVVRDVLAAKGLRPSQYHIHVPAITALVFVPSKWDLVEHRILASDEIKELFLLYESKTALQKMAGYKPLPFKDS